MPFQKSVLVPLNADDTFALITQPDRLRRCQVITARVDLRAGGDYRWTVIPGNSAAGTFTEVEPGRRVVFTWGWEGSAEVPPGASTVTITLEPAAGGTMVHLVHEGLTGEQEASHAAGWNHYLGRLVTAATDGDAGADEWAAAPPDLNPINAAEATLATCQLVLRGIAEADYHHATVCTEFDVTQLADHLIGSVTFLGTVAGAGPGAGAAPAAPPRPAPPPPAPRPDPHRWRPGSPTRPRRRSRPGMSAAWTARSRSARTRCPPARPWVSCRSSSWSTGGTSPRPPASRSPSRTRSPSTSSAWPARSSVPRSAPAEASPTRPQSRMPACSTGSSPSPAAPSYPLSAPYLRRGKIMPTMTSYAQGTPNWVDLQTSDQDAAKAFYAGLFGWTYDDQPMPQGRMYSMAVLGGHPVAAIASQSPELAAAGAPPMWNTYLAVDSVDEAAGRVEAAGGKVAMAPFDVMDAGRMAFVLDPAGAPVALWQANQHIGATLVNEPGAVTWNELITTDPGVVKFYADVLGMTTSTMDMGGGPYTVFEAGGRMVGGTTAPQMPGVPNHWHVYFEVADADAAAAKAAELGGTVMVAPFDIPVGRIAVIGDPQGAVFSIIKSVPQP